MFLNIRKHFSKVKNETTISYTYLQKHFPSHQNETFTIRNVLLKSTKLCF